MYSFSRAWFVQKNLSSVEDSYQRHVQLFFIKDFESSLDVVPEFLSINWDIVLVHPVRIKNRSQECIVPVDVGEVANSNLIDVFIRPIQSKSKIRTSSSFSKTICQFYQTRSSSRTRRSWNNLKASWTKRRTRPSTDRDSKGLMASHMPRTHLRNLKIIKNVWLNIEFQITLSFLLESKCNEAAYPGWTFLVSSGRILPWHSSAAQHMLSDWVRAWA